MSTLRGWFAPILLLAGSALMADDFQLTTSPPPPWSTTEAVVLTLTIHNTSNETRRYAVDFNGFDRSLGLVDRLDVLDTEAMGTFEPICSDIGPTLGDLTFCLSTAQIAANASRKFQFDVIAHPNALGAATGGFEIHTLRPDFASAGVPVIHSPSTLFAYGFAPHASVPSLNLISIMALTILVAMITALHLRSLRES